MKRHLISAFVVLVFLATAWVVFGQHGRPAGEEPRMISPYEHEDWRLFQMLPPEEAAEMRIKWPSMSEEEKEKFRAEMREKWEGMPEQEREKLRGRTRDRFGSRREDQLKAIQTIEEQLVKLKEGLEGMERGASRGMSPEEWVKLREKWTKIREEQQDAIGAIIAQIVVLQGRGQPAAEGEELIIVDTGELKAIRELAEKEKAKETAQRLGMLVGSWGERPLGQEQRPQKPQLREIPVKEQSAREAPAFTLSSFDGETVSLSDYKGKIVVLEWFNLECPFVKYHYDTAHTMVELANKYKNKNVVWLAVNSTNNTTQEANKEFAKKHKLPYPIFDDRSGKIGLYYGARTTPHMFIINTEGKIVYEGAIDNSPMGTLKKGVVNYVDKALEELTGGKSVSVASSKPYGCSVKYAR
jgi:peroxiredoxin